MRILPNIVFAVILIAGGGYFAMNIKKIIRNIKLGQECKPFR